MPDIRKRIFEVLDKTHLMSLATQDENGVWVCDVIFLHDENMNIYWLSSPDCRHSKAILKNSQAAGTITFSTKNKEQNFGLQFEGNAEQLKGVHFDLIIKHWSKRNHKIPDISKALEVLEGDYWYKLTPKKMYLIDEENFGFDRQELVMEKINDTK